ncbi:hypothetical protein J437_LFUL016935 [Ladona fulva]|uniref:Sodium-coupled monocarboxylate transporter 2 n=1 Tax=Ladona fulva TaxID=123851 RepID=A0A8K0KMM9_LADFU|nr:hypothetical protein J437_LFUL016935 [Ladona fulva]
MKVKDKSTPKTILSEGGVKAIIWSDTFHLAILMITLIILIVKGTIDAGGVGTVWNDNYNSGRIELFNFDPDPTIRHSFWTVFVGGTIYWTAICAVNQNAIQRFLSLPSMRDVYKTVWLATAGKIIIYTLLFYIGMLIYSTYKNCDPLASKMVKRTDQLLPLYVLDEMGTWAGFPGTLVASVFSASIGAVATMLNGMTAVTVRDFVQGMLRKKLTEVEAGTLSKFICLGFGLASLGFVFLVSQIGGLLQTAYSITGLVGGVGLGIYTLGVFFPWANWKGALGGIICSFAFMIWVVWGAVMASKDGYQSAHRKPISVENCLCNATLEVSQEPSEYILPIYKVSYLWYTGMSMTLSIIVGIIISGLTVFQDPRELDHALISPIAKLFFILVI